MMKYAETLSSKSEIHHSAGGSIRFVGDQGCSLQPGISLSIPLEDRFKRWFLGFDLALRY